jgi:predicted nucleotidyltransferase
MAADPQLLERLRTGLAAGPPLRLAVLFGSAARGQAGPASDLDVAIVPADADLPLGVELGLQADLTLQLGREVDLVRLDRAPTLVRWQVARDGVLILARERSDYTCFLAAAASEWFDFEPAFNRASAHFRRRLAEDGR